MLPPLLGALIPGLLSAGLDMIGARQQNRANNRAAERAQRFSAGETDTAAQRRVADLRAAGLNPALAYDQSAQSAPGVMVGQQSVLGSGASGARAGAGVLAQLENVKANTQLLKEQAFSQQYQRGLLLAQGEATTANARLTEQSRLFQAASQPSSLRTAVADAVLREAQGAGQGTQNQLLGYQLPGARAAASFSGSLGRFAPATNFFLGSAKTATSLFRR